MSRTASSPARRGRVQRLAGAAVPPRVLGERLICSLCGDSRPDRPLDSTAPPTEAVVPCHVRAFQGQQFRVWRCAGCGTLHCRERVDLNTYYAQYPFAQARLTRPFRLFYGNLLRRLRGQGLRPEHRLLDYGCGKGLFLKFLGRRGYRRAVGYDPYGDPSTTGNPAVLAEAAYDFILLQDVLEHVEDPRGLLAELDRYLRPGGTILIGTPNASRIDLARPERFLNELHAPYHLHIYDRAGVEALGRERGWIAVGYYDRPYHDLLIPGLNTRAAKAYQAAVDGTLDAGLEKIDAWAALGSGAFWWRALTGYFTSDRADMTVVFRKRGAAVS